MQVWKMNFLFNWVTFRFHANFSGMYLEDGHFGTPDFRVMAAAWFLTAKRQAQVVSNWYAWR